MIEEDLPLFVRELEKRYPRYRVTEFHLTMAGLVMETSENCKGMDSELAEAVRHATDWNPYGKYGLN